MSPLCRSGSSFFGSPSGELQGAIFPLESLDFPRCGKQTAGVDLVLLEELGELAGHARYGAPEVNRTLDGLSEADLIPRKTTGVQVSQGSTLEAELEEAVQFSRAASQLAPRVGVVLGSGLGDFADSLSDLERHPYRSIPHFPVATVSGHAGYLCVGRLGALAVACLQGRVHGYEGHLPGRVVFGVRLLASLGCQVVVLTNAAGGIRDDLGVGSLMALTDHLNLTGQNPLVGPPGAGLVRFPDMTHAYEPRLRELGREAAGASGLDLKEGVYAGLLGPSYETPAEVRMLRVLGADAVGMSTVLETIALRQRGVRLAAVSLITNRAAGLSGRPLQHTEVERTASDRSRQVVEFLRHWVTRIGAELGCDC